jgi:hypothetical protein
MRSDQSDGEMPGVGVRSQITALTHRREAAVKHREPIVVAAGQFCPGVVVGLDQFADQ